MKPETLKMLQENIASILQDIGRGEDSLNQTIDPKEIRTTATKRDLILLKSFCTAKETIKQVSENPQSGRKSSPVTHLIGI